MTDDRLPLRIYLLGGLRVVAGAGEVRLAGGRLRSLLAYLLLHAERAHTRERLADLLWPEATERQGRHNLANALYGLRRALGVPWPASEGEQLFVRAGGDLWVDVWEFERCAASEARELLEQAAALYAGELLPELYDDWVLVRRQQLQERYLALLLRLGELDAGQPEMAVQWFRQALTCDQLHEAAARGLMRCLAQTGRAAEALALYERFAVLLAEQIGAQPEEQTQRLARQLQAERELCPATELLPPFVGRARERALLLARLEQARQGRGGLVVITGEAGIGKSRLAEELARAAGWRGWQVARGSSAGPSGPAPFEPLATALAQALPLPRVQQLAGQIQPLWLALLGRIVPGLIGVLREPPRLSVPDERRTLVTALRHVLGALHTLAPQLLILDEMQHADPAVWELLEGLREPLAGLAVLVVVIVRDDELAAQPAALLQSWDGVGVTCVRLEGLAAAELAELAVAQGRHEYTPAAVLELHTASGGNPLLALELLYAGGSGRLLERPNLAGLLAQRTDQLSPKAQRAIQAAAVVGRYFTHPVWAAVLAALEDQAEPNVPAETALELERAGLMRLEAARYVFVHDALRVALYEQLSPDERLRLHRAAHTALRQADPVDLHALLYHAGRAGDVVAAAAAATAAGEQALAGYAFETARRLFEQALATLPAADLARRYAAQRGLLRALDVLADRVTQREGLMVLRELADRLGDQRFLAEATWLQAEYCWRTGASDEAAALAEQVRDLALACGDGLRCAQALELLSQVAQQRGSLQAARALLVEARALYSAAGEGYGAATTTHNLAVLDWAAGEHYTAISGYEEAVATFHRLGDLYQEARALNSLGAALWSTGDYLAARTRHERALALARDLGDRWSEAANTLNLGHVALAIGDYVTAIDCFSTALASFRAGNSPPGLVVCMSNLSSAYRLIGDAEAALNCATEALEASRAIGSRRLEGYALHNRGMALLDLAQVAEALEALEAACILRVELGERDNLAESRAALALAALATGAEQVAGHAVAQALALIAAGDVRPALRQWVQFTACRVLEAAGDAVAAQQHLRLAATAMAEAAAKLAPAERELFLSQVPLNRETRAALDSLCRREQVRLTRAGVPLGRRLQDGDFVSLEWTLSTPEDAAIERDDERRRHILQRLVAEAAAEGGAPTDDDLATALGVSRRTVLRDIEQLAQQGVVIATRRRR